MASVQPWKKRIKVRFWINGQHLQALSPQNPTKAGCRSVAIRAEEWDARLRLGEPWPVIKAEIEEKQPVVAFGTLEYYAQHYLDTAEIERTSILNAQKSYNRVWSAFGDQQITTLQKSELQRHLDSFGYTEKTKKNHISVLRRIFEVLKDDGYTGPCPTDRWKVRKTQKPEKDPYTAEERDTLIAALEEPYRAFFVIGFFCGMRTSEILALQPKHIKGNKIRIEQVRVDRHLELRTKTHRAREVVAPKIVRDAVERYRFQEWIFERRRGEPYLNANDFLDAFWAAHDKTGVRRRQGTKKYPWRMTYISLALRAGVRPGLVASQTGHNERTMWDDYAQYLPGEDDAAIIEKVFET